MTAGGIWPAICGTFMLTVGTALFALPVGIAAGIYLAEYAKRGPGTRVMRLSIANMAGVPSIVYGLFGLSLFVIAVRSSASRCSRARSRSRASRCRSSSPRPRRRCARCRGTCGRRRSRSGRRKLADDHARRAAGRRARHRDRRRSSACRVRPARRRPSSSPRPPSSRPCREVAVSTR